MFLSREYPEVENKRTNDVYYRLAYLDGRVERLSFDYEDPDSEESDRGQIAYQTRIPSSENDILFNIDFTKSRRRLNSVERELLDWLVVGYNPKEISRVMRLDYNNVRLRLRRIGSKFTEFFQCRDPLFAG